jgi:SAM-dependent MidA family methyltransferase
MKMPATLIREEIHKKSVIPFARFMELALYCPETGYYEAKRDKIGRRGDFITSVSVGSLFGELLAFQFAEWLQELPVGAAPGGEGSQLAIVEAGAHDGQLAGDILAWLEINRHDLFAQIGYLILEPSTRRREWQQENLKRFAPRVRWCEDFQGLGPARISGILFGNELLDAFPVRRFGWDAAQRHWFEWGVGLERENFCWRRLDGPEVDAVHFCAPELEAVLPDGYVIETSPAAEEWWRQAAGSLARGKLLAIDYGYSAEEMISPARTDGTLRAYRRHQVTRDLLAEAGEQDLTAHVNFTAIQSAGEAAGLQTMAFCPQPQFLTRILQQAVAKKFLLQMNPKQVRQFQTLTHPEHLGRAFRVLLQGR